MLGKALNCRQVGAFAFFSVRGELLSNADGVQSQLLSRQRKEKTILVTDFDFNICAHFVTSSVPWVKMKLTDGRGGIKHMIHMLKEHNVTKVVPVIVKRERREEGVLKSGPICRAIN